MGEEKMNQSNKTENRSDAGEILLNLMFRGKYLQDNIGHEIINMFKADDNANYIYVNPYGTFHKSHSGKIETILLGRYSGDNCIEIIAKAEKLTEMVDVSKGNEEIKAKQRETCAKICYGGGEKNIIQIFETNDAQDQVAWISFCAGKYRRTLLEKKLFITDDSRQEKREESQNVFFIGDINNPEKIRFPKQSLKAYYAKGTDTDIAYKVLNRIIHDDQFWEKRNETKKVKKSDAKDVNGNFLKLIHKENDELSFSNLLAHYLSPRFGLLERFARNLLQLEMGRKYSILREWENIDLLIEDENQIIVIENKIKSKINGIRHDTNGEIVQNQLNDYIRKAKERALPSKEHENQKTTSFYLFSPNYNHIDPKVYEGGERYKIVLYSEIYQFFKENKPANADRFYDDFVRALHKHISNYADDLYGEMLQKFAEAIQIGKSTENSSC